MLIEGIKSDSYLRKLRSQIEGGERANSRLIRRFKGNKYQKKSFNKVKKYIEAEPEEEAPIAPAGSVWV